MPGGSGRSRCGWASTRITPRTSAASRMHTSGHGPRRPAEGEGMKFLVMWELGVASLRAEMVQAVMRMPDYAKRVKDQGKLVARYHVVGKHGGAWIYDVDSNEELERLLATAPVYNYARFEVTALAEMETPTEVLQLAEGEAAG